MKRSYFNQYSYMDTKGVQYIWLSLFVYVFIKWIDSSNAHHTFFVLIIAFRNHFLKKYGRITGTLLALNVTRE